MSSLSYPCIQWFSRRWRVAQQGFILFHTLPSLFQAYLYLTRITNLSQEIMYEDMVWTLRFYLSSLVFSFIFILLHLNYLYFIFIFLLFYFCSSFSLCTFTIFSFVKLIIIWHSDAVCSREVSILWSYLYYIGSGITFLSFAMFSHHLFPNHQRLSKVFSSF